MNVLQRHFLCIVWLSIAQATFPSFSVAQSSEGSRGIAPLADYKTDLPPQLIARISIKVDELPLSTVLRQISLQSGIPVVFDTDLMEQADPITISVAEVGLIEAFEAVLAGTGFEAFVMPGVQILITRSSEAAPAPVSRQSVRGRVIDRVTQAPLPGANVVVLSSDPLIGAMTRADGSFVLSNVPIGRHDLQASFIGYETVIIPGVLVTSGREINLSINLREQVLTGEEVVILPSVQRGEPSNDMAMVSGRSFSVEETRRYAGGVDDPARMASAFAGVISGGMEDNALIIRGNAPRGVLWRLEGVEIPNPNHFAGLQIAGGGGLTIFSSQMLDDSDFFTGAFPAEYGNALAGVFDMRLRSGNANRREYAAQLGLIGLDVGAEGPFSTGKPSSYLFNYRYSTLGLIMPLLPIDDLIQYQDLSFKLAFPAASAGRFEVWGMGGLDRQNMVPKMDPASWKSIWDRTDFDLHLGIGAAGATHELLLGSRTFLRSSLALTANRTQWDRRKLDDALVLRDDLRISDNSGRAIVASHINHKFGAWHVNRTGFYGQQLFYDFNLLSAADQNMLPLAQDRGSSSLLQIYSQSQFELSPKLSLNSGLHGQYFALTGSYSVEPRTGLRWQFSNGQALTIGYGSHSQVDDLRIYFIQLPDGTQPNRELGLTKAHHWVGGYERRLGDSGRLKSEVYFQYLFDVPVIADSSFSMQNFEQDWQFANALVNEGAGRNYGLELTLERFLRDGYYYLVTGSLFKSEYRGGDDLWRNSRFDRTFAVDGLFGKELALRDGRNLLGLNGRLTVTGGKRRSPVDRPASVASRDVIYDESRAFEVQDSPGIFLDVTFTYTRNHRRHTDVWALQVKNALLTKHRFHYYSYSTGGIEEGMDGFILPQLSYKIEF